MQFPETPGIHDIEIRQADGRHVRYTVSVPQGEETFSLCRTRGRQEKERAIRQRFTTRMEEALRRILVDVPVPLRKRNPGVSRDLAVVVAVAMEKDPARRYATAADLADDLEAVFASQLTHCKLPNELAESFSEIGHRWSNLSFEERREIVECVTERIDVGDIKVTCSFVSLQELMTRRV